MKINYKIVYFPFIILLFLFLLDKIFLIKNIQLLTQKDATFLYYQYKNELLDKLETLYKTEHKNIILVIGSSRLMFIDYNEFKKIYKNWELFNFSVPVNSPAYYLFLIEKIVKRNIKPTLLILESDPYQFNEYSPGFKKSNLPYAFDIHFVIKYFSLFERDEVSEFLGYTLFAGKRYPPDLYVLFQRLLNPQDKILLLFNETEKYQRETNGCGLVSFAIKEWYLRDLSEIEISAINTKNWLYKNYKESNRQWKFFENTIHVLKKNQIPFIVIKPQLSPIMEEILKKDPVIAQAYINWEDKIQKLIPADQFIDFSKSEEFYCNTFVDGSHMSRECYDPMLFEILKKYNKISKDYSLGINQIGSP